MNQNLLFKEIKTSDVGGEFTSKEILGQPDLWLKLFESVKNRASEIVEFIEKTKKSESLYVILTGAGTSAFIGDALVGTFQKKMGLVTKAVATTDLVTHPEYFFQHNKDVLLISFARSGNSPESAKAVQLAEQFSHKAFNFVITCSKNSKLKEALNSDDFTFFLPPEADDKSLAMTGSFTTMLLTGLLVSDIYSLEKKESEIKLLRTYADKIFGEYLGALYEVSKIKF